MAAEGKAIIFTAVVYFLFFFVSIDERPAVRSQPDLASRSEVVSICKCLPNILEALPLPQTRGAKTSHF